MYNFGTKWEKYMFYGQKELLIDDKGRLVLSSNYREEFNDLTVFAAFGYDNCIELFKTVDYQRKAEEIMSLSDFDLQARKVKRTFLSNTFKLQLDSHGRVLLPKILIDKTLKSKKVMVVGMYDHLEIWDYDTFVKNQADNDKSFAQDAQEVLGK